MVSKYFQNYASYYLSKYWVTKGKFEYKLKNKVAKDFLQKKITENDKRKYLDEIFQVLKYYEAMGFFDEKKLVDLKIENLVKKGFSLKKIRMALKQDYFEDILIENKISKMSQDENANIRLMTNFLSKSSVSCIIKSSSCKTEIFKKILKKFINQGFNYSDSVNFLKNNIKVDDV